MSVMPLELVIASANPDKAAELQQLLTGELGDAVRLRPRPDYVGEIEETGETLEENARLKAETICQATGLAAIADDTGLEVYALGGAPGVYSARYAGEDASYADNVAKLLVELDGQKDRSARFRTVCVISFPDGSELIAEGAVDGLIATEASGTSGFGYDPLFRPISDSSRTYAEMSAAEKHDRSHRGLAVRNVAGLLRSKLNGES
jgi:XTP/dITP diphosphohydrolase